MLPACLHESQPPDQPGTLSPVINRKRRRRRKEPLSAQRPEEEEEEEMYEYESGDSSKFNWDVTPVHKQVFLIHSSVRGGSVVLYCVMLPPAG